MFKRLSLKAIVLIASVMFVLIFSSCKGTQAYQCPQSYYGSSHRNF